MKKIALWILSAFFVVSYGDNSGTEAKEINTDKRIISLSKQKLILQKAASYSLLQSCHSSHYSHRSHSSHRSHYSSR